MDLDAIQASPIGRCVPIAVPKPDGQQGSYFAYVPDPLPAAPSLGLRAVDAATKAAMAVARLDQAVAQLPRPGLLLRPVIRREATSTSALEGTYAAFDEVLEADFLEDRQLSSELREIQNFIRAAEDSVEQLKAMPIGRRLIGDLQTKIVRGTPGESYDMGDLRQRQVYIGAPGRPVEEARFVPCPPGDLLVQGFSDWERWLHADNHVPIIIRLALGHYQFETLHPYADGNGRLGRLICILQLVEEGALKHPILNLSPWLEARRDEYIDGLLQTTLTGDFNGWVEFFAEAVRVQADQGVEQIRDLLTYRDTLLARLRASGARGTVLDVADSLIGYPIIDVRTAAKMTGKTFETANQAIARLVSEGTLTEATGRPVNRLFICREVLQILNRK